MLDSPPLPPPAPDRFWPSSQKILAYANRAHATSYELASEFSRAGTVLTYRVEDTSGQQALLTWSLDSSRSQVPSVPAAETPPAGVAAGRTPKGYPYRLASVRMPDRPGPSAGRPD
jgi:hypothetical protein